MSRKKIGSVSKLQTVFRSPFIHITVADVTFPQTTKKKKWWFYMERDVVQIIPLLPNGSCIMNKQWRPGAKKYTLEFPVGYIEKTDTSVRFGATREMCEETGYTTRRMKLLGSAFVSPSNQSNRIYFYIAENCVLTNKKELDNPNEQIENVEVSIHNVYEYIADGKIECVTTIAAATFLKMHNDVR